MTLYIPAYSTEAEIKVLFKAILKTKQFSHFLQHLEIYHKDPIPVYEDNSTAINLVKANKLIT